LVEIDNQNCLFLGFALPLIGVCTFNHFEEKL